MKWKRCKRKISCILAIILCLTNGNYVSASTTETIIIDFDVLKEGTYDYYVKWFDGEGTWTSSGAKVQVYLDNTLINEFSAPGNSEDGKGTIWNVFSVNCTNKTITAK